MNRDRINNANPAAVATVTMTALTALQNFSPADQLMASAALFVSLAGHLRIPEQDVFTAIKNLMVESDRTEPAFRAVKQYMREEIPT